MVRMARAVIPNIPHHVTQRGVRSLPIFHSESDYHIYLKLIQKQCEEHELSILTYCLMPNHVHFLAVPGTSDSLANAIGEAHRRYTLHINKQQNVKGHLFQERFFSCPLDIKHTFAAFKYILQNPVKANIVRNIEDYEWSGAKYHLSIADSDPLIDSEKVADYIGGTKDLLLAVSSVSEELIEQIRKTTRTGRPCGGELFVKKLESITGRRLSKQKPGPKIAKQSLSNSNSE